MPESPGRKLNRYYENLQNQRKRDEARNRPLIEETDVVEFFKHLGFQATVYQEKLLRDKSQFILARWSRQSGKSLAIRNGCVIEALPNNPDTIRGETLNTVVLDEFAYIEHDKELYDAIIFALSTTNGSFYGTSTP